MTSRALAKMSVREGQTLLQKGHPDKEGKIVASAGVGMAVVFQANDFKIICKRDKLSMTRTMQHSLGSLK